MEARMIVTGGVCLFVGVLAGLFFGGARIREERTKAYRRGRDAAFQEMARHGVRMLRVVPRDSEYDGSAAESRGGRAS